MSDQSSIGPRYRASGAGGSDLYSGEGGGLVSVSPLLCRSSLKRSPC